MSPVEYIEYMRGGATYVQVATGPTTFETFGPYHPKPGSCPRCRNTSKHTVGGVHRCTKCLNYWPEEQNDRL